MPRSCPEARGLVAAALMLWAAPLAAQYPLAPSPVLDLRTLSPEVRLGGYVSVRGTERHDTLTFIVNRARVTALARPGALAALRMQVDYTAIGRTSADTVPAFVLTDAYLQIGPASPDRPGERAVTPALVVGQFRTPFALEFLTPFSLLQAASRSQTVDRLATRRDIGVLGQLAGGQRLILLGALVNGEGSNRITNADGTEMIVGRLTVFPLPGLAVAAKYAAHGSDHRWGYDARWIGRGAIVEGEFIGRRGPFAPGTTTDAAGGYVLASYKVRPWLQPVIKWEQLRDARTTGGTTTKSRLTSTTVGLNVLSRGESIRLLVNGVLKSERPVTTGNEILAQLIAIF